MTGSRMAKKAKERAQKRAAKAAAMMSPGFKSKYAKRKEARMRGEPMAARERRPWWGALSFPVEGPRVPRRSGLEPDQTVDGQ